MVRGQWREFSQDTGVTPLLFMRSDMRFLSYLKHKKDRGDDL